MILRIPFCVALISGTLIFTPSESKAEELTKSATTSYERAKDWPALPKGHVLRNPTGLDIDSEGNLWVFHRGSRKFTFPMPQNRIPANTVTKIDSESGRILNAWGKDLFIMPHGLAIDGSDHVWVSDVGLHQVFKFDSEGTLLMTHGEAGVSGQDATHFKLPTDVAVASDGSLYVADGYGNSRMAKFSADGMLLAEWGSRGRGRDELRTPHGIALDKDEDGKILGSDFLRLDLNLKLQIRFGRSSAYDGAISRYHDIAVDSAGNVYGGNILGNTIQKFGPTR